jgi:membrane-associated phospholipid phosphatase
VRPNPRLALAGALGCLVALAATGLVALLTDVGVARDSSTLTGFVALDEGWVATAATYLANLCNPGPDALACVARVAIALARGRRPIALAVPVIMVGAEATTQALKPLLAPATRGSEWLQASVAPASWPSGHATAALAIALCAVLVSPARLRPAVALAGSLFAVAVGYAVLVLAWHFPSDVLGGYLVAAVWTLCAVAVLVARERRPATPAPPRWRGELAVAALGGAALVALALEPGYADRHPAALVAAAAIAALALALGWGVERAARG